MEIFTSILLILHCSWAFGIENFKNDSLAFVTDSDNYSQGNISGKHGRSRENYLKILLSDTFWIAQTLQDSSQCKIHMNTVLREAAQLNMWALRMLDSSAKLPSGILSGNLNQVGDFDECLTSFGQSGTEIIKGKYCLANIEIQLTNNETNERIKEIDDAIHSYRMLRNGLSVQGHRIPRLETFNWGICIPSSCSSEEIQSAFDDHLNGATRGKEVSFRVSVNDEVCYVKHEKEFSLAKLIVILIFSSILLLILFGTLLDTQTTAKKDSKAFRILLCFSLKRNWAILLKTDTSEDEIKCFHGGRFLNALGLLFSHKEIAFMFYPLLNRNAMSESLSKPWTMLGRSSILYTDSFILISGTLASYSMIKDLDNKKSFNFKDKLISRIIRFTPNLFGIILFFTYIMADMNSGPQWGLVVDKYANLCKKNMWRNFLYIHNLFGFENMCLTHTHQIGIDMQLFVISPLFIYLLWKIPKLGYVFIATFALLSTWLRYDITYRENISTLLYFGISVERLWKTANLSYILPTHRLTVYLIGIFLGYFLRRGGKTLKLSYLQATVGWIIAISAALLSVFGYYQAASKNYTYNVNESANFNAFVPILWVMWLFWVVIACVNGFGGFFNDFLCWKYFTIFSRISYAVYLTQFPVFFYNVGSERGIQYFKGFGSLIDVVEFGVILIASVILTLTFDIPSQELRKVLLTSPIHQTTSSERVRDKLKDKSDQDDTILKELNQSITTIKQRRKLQSFGT